jgi:glutamyl-tRNA(Gln) amidotransferase subunit D
VNAEVLAHVHVLRDGISHTLMPEYEAALKSTPPRVSPSSEPTTYDGAIRVAQLLAGAHLHGDLITSVADAGYRALVIHGTGLGHLPIENANGDAPENEELEAAISAAINGGLRIIIANQCINGAVNMNVYSKGRRQQELGLLGQGGTSTPEAVVVKTHWSLSQGRDLSADLDSNLIGENPDRILS